jgi:hypothetical protein
MSEGGNLDALALGLRTSLSRICALNWSSLDRAGISAVDASSRAAI